MDKIDEALEWADQVADDAPRTTYEAVLAAEVRRRARGGGVMQTPEDFVKTAIYPERAFIAAITARDAEWQALVDRLTAVLQACTNIRRMVESVERGESYEGGEPDIGTCKILDGIKHISDQARDVLAESEAAHE